MAIPAVVGLGLSAISTVSGLSSAQRAARRQDEAAEMSAADAKQRIELAQEEFGFVHLQAKRLRDEELMMINDQRRAAQMQLTQQVLNNKLATVQTQMEAAGIKSQAREVALSLLTQAQQEAAQVGETNAGQLRELNQAGVEVRGGIGTRARDLQTDRATNALEQARGAILEDAQVRRGLSNENAAQAGIMGGIQSRMMNIAADAAIDQQKLQTRMLNKQMPHAKAATNIQAQRNRQAIDAKMYSTQATANMSALSATLQEREYIRGIEAQKASIQRPGFLSYLQAGAGLYNQGMSAGLWGQPQSRFANTPSTQFGVNSGYQFNTNPQINAPNLNGQLSFSASPLMDRLNQQQQWQQGRITDIPGNIHG